MNLCVNPECENPHNRDSEKLCQSCGSGLILRQRYRPIKYLSRGGFGRTFLVVDEDIPSQPKRVLKQFDFLKQTPEPELWEHAQKLFQRFNYKAPVGHLPSRVWVSGSQWLRHAAVMASKLTKCSQSQS